MVFRVVTLDGTWHMLLVTWSFSYMTGMWTLPAGAQIRYSNLCYTEELYIYVNRPLIIQHPYNEALLFKCFN